MANYPSTQNTDDNLYIAVNNLSTSLTDNPLTAGATTVNVVDTTGFPTVGILTIDLEAIHYTGTTATSFTGCTRGFDGTTAASHTQTTSVFHDIPAAHHNTLKDEIKAVSDDLRDSFTADLDDSVAATATATDLKERLDQMATQLKAVINGVDWKGTPTDNLSNLDLEVTLNGLAITQLNNDKADDVDVVHLAGSETITGEKTFSADILAAAGSDASPSITFSGDPDTGVYSVTANEVGFSTGGSARWRITAAGKWAIDSTDNTSGAVLAGAGTTGAPAYTFNVTGGSTTGVYLIGTSPGRLGIVTDGVQRISISDSSTTTSNPIYVGNGTIGAPGLGFNSDTDTGLYRVTTDQMGIVAGGSTAGVFANVSAVAGFFAVDGTTARPGIAWNSDPNTGLTRAGADIMDLVCNGATSARVDNDGTAGNTRLLIYDVDNATLERVTVGAADSGGAGFKVLRIPN